MFPIRDHNPSNRTPYVTYLLLAINILIFISYVGVMQDARALNGIWWSYAMIPGRVMNGDAEYTLVTSMFLHGGVMHLVGNMLFLYIFGDNVEDTLGHWRFLGFYLAAGILAALSQLVTEPYSQVPMVGASGAIAGVMGAYLLLFPKAKVDVLIILIVFFRVLPTPAWIMLAIWFGMQFVGGIGAEAGTGGVAYWAHAGGFLAGVLLALPSWLRRGGPAFWDRTHGIPPHPEARYRISQSRIPKVARRR
ncbi:MAG: rhomboid family intramembrane serine protease [Pseudomonadota bacterium]